MASGLANMRWWSATYGAMMGGASHVCFTSLTVGWRKRLWLKLRWVVVQCALMEMVVAGGEVHFEWTSSLCQVS